MPDARCYVLGAGFSHVCGLPLAKNLTEVVLTDILNDQKAIRPDLWDAYRDFVCSLFPSCDCQARWPHIEDLISELDQVVESKRRPNIGVDGTAEHLKECLLKRLRTDLIREGLHAPEVEKKLVRDFTRQVIAENASVVSFNWDLLLENACAEVSRGCNYQTPSAGALLLTKLHGSLNLVRVSRADYADLASFVNIRNLEIEWESPCEVILRAIDPEDSANRTQHPFGENEQVFIQPAARKEYGHPWIEAQWRQAAHALSGAREIVVIGYSFPESDVRSYSLLRQSATCDVGGITRRLVVVDPCADEVASRISKQLSADIERISHGWTEWFQSDR